MHEEQGNQPVLISSGQKAVGLSLSIFVLWIVLMAIGLAAGTLYDGGGYAMGNYIPLLVVSLILVFVILPFMPKWRSGTYAESLREAGILFRVCWADLAPLGLFLMISSLGFYYDLRGGMQDIVSYHRNLGLFMILLSSIQPAISEEIVIRGAMYGVIRRYCGPLPAILGTAFAFGLIHLAQGPARFFFGFTVGLALGVLRWRTRTIWAGSAVHFMINFGTPIPAWTACLATIAVSFLTQPPRRLRKQSTCVGAG